jgi:hypothetical protein
VKIMPFSKVPNGALFRVCVDGDGNALVRSGKSGNLKPDASSIGEQPVKTEGIYIKIGESHSVTAACDVKSKEHKDAIFLHGTLCRVIRDDIDTSHLADWAIVNAGRARSAS